MNEGKYKILSLNKEETQSIIRKRLIHTDDLI